MILFADTETYSDVPIKDGTHRYAERSEVIISAWAIGDGDVRVEEGLHPDFVEALAAADEVVFHNLAFDRTVLRAQGVDVPLAKAHCTMARALAHSLPGGLGALCDVLGVPTDKAKDKEGRQWIQLFCKPRPKNSELRRATKTTHPEQWRRFIDYAGLDIHAMREVYRRLPRWNYQGAERALWALDQQINDRGFAVDLALSETAISAVEAEKRRLANRVQEMTDGEVEAATQRDKMLAHLLEQYGIKLPDMQKGTLERRVNDPDLPEPVRELLAIRLEASTTSTAKYRSLINAASSDSRLRGGLQFCGAARTGRWSGRIFQPQNLPRPKHDYEEVEASIAALKAGCADLIYGDVIGRASSCIRSAIVAPEGKKLVAADLSNIEGRMLAWLAYEEWKIDAFADFDQGVGHDLYKIAYARSFNMRPEDVTKDQRQLGKVQELALGYQGAVGAFASMAALYGMSLPEDEVLRLVKAWRKAHPNVVSFWYALEAKAIEATLNPGVTLSCCRLKLRRDGAWLRIVLPSGRALCYPSPKIDEDGRLTYMGVNQYTRKWERLNTYGGKLAENATQAASRDVLASAMPKVEAAGYSIVLTVHDEIVTEAPEVEPFGPVHLSNILAENPRWAAGLPLAAAGFEGPRYRKD